MDSDIVLKDDGTVEVTGGRFKTSVGDIEMYYRGGHLSTKDSGVELGSTDRGALRGFSQVKDGTVTVTGDRTTLWSASVASIQAAEVRIEGNAAGKNVAKFNVQSPAVQLGSQVADKFCGISILPSGLWCHGPGVSVLNPAVAKPDANQRFALSHDAEDRLVLNAGARYTGGVKVEGKLELGAESLAQGQLAVSAAGKLLLLRPDISHRDPRTGMVIRIPVAPLDVLQALVALQQTVQDLTNRLAALEAKVLEPTPS